jgi:vancomycin resistance protein YoaR
VSDPPESLPPIGEASAALPPTQSRALAALSWLRPAVLPALLTFALGSVCGQFLLEDRDDRQLPRDVFVLGKDVSGWDLATARAKLTERAKASAGRELAVEIDGKATHTSGGELGLGIDAGKTLDAALAARWQKPILQRFSVWLKSVFSTLPAVAPSLTVDQARLDQKLAELERLNLTLVFAGGFRVDSGRVVADYPREGRRIRREAAIEALKTAFQRGAERVVLTTERAPATTEPSAIDRLVSSAERVASREIVLGASDLKRKLVIAGPQLLSALRVARTADAEPSLVFDSEALMAAIGSARAEVENEAHSARFVIDASDKVSIVASEPERRLQPAELARVAMLAAASAERQGMLPLVEVAQPPLSSEQAAKLGIRGLVSQFTTRHPCCERRVDNIHRISDLLNGLIVKPGETVSVNAVIGPRTSKNGFVPAPTIEEGEMVETIGGGISQFATTLFNALFHGGYDIIERQPHTYWFTRYPMGHEATLSFPKPDLVFRNDTEAGMLFDTRYTKTSITVRIFGDNGGRRVEAKVSPRQNIVEAPVEILPNPEVSPDKEHVLQGGMIGWSVVVARLLHFPDGTTREEKRKVTYKPKTRRVEVHPCRVPKGDPGYTGERCPEPPAEEESVAASVSP